MRTKPIISNPFRITAIQTNFSAADIPVKVTLMSGALVFQASLPVTPTLLDLKDQIYKKTRVPPFAQKIVCGAQVLQENDDLSTLGGLTDLKLIMEGTVFSFTKLQDVASAFFDPSL